MKLQDYTETLEEKMSEFDIWVTPSLGEIRDMPQFQVNLENIKQGFTIIAELTDEFEKIENCASSHLANKLVEYLTDNIYENEKIINSVCNVLFLVTGKTDNNLKCQFPLLLRNTYGIYKYPQKNSTGRWVDKNLPRTLQYDAVTKIILQLSEKEDMQKTFLESYFHLILSDEQYSKQLWSLGRAFCNQRTMGNEESLLSPIVIFQSRGSITATQGHIPENILREYMIDWGLEAGQDFNTQDVEIGEILDGIEVAPDVKKRKFDFILPYQSRDTGTKIFIQSQFYAGDSGSVSHKVVDQTDSSRKETLKKYPEAVFIEYLDGAGYFSSLNGDLRKMLAKATTKDFIQITSAPIKLRRELQEIRFLTVLEIEHAIIMTGGNKEKVENLLINDGYDKNEIQLVIDNALSHEIISESADLYNLREDRECIVRKYCLLDVIANYGNPIPTDNAVGFLMVPGYSTMWGMPQSDVIKRALEVAPMLEKIWKSHAEPFDDIQWLLEKGFVKSK